jgi:TRAP-type transport system periplasmic protein
MIPPTARRDSRRRRVYDEAMRDPLPRAAPLRVALLALALASALPRPARADGDVLRFATMAPAGTAWAREFNAFARDVEEQSGVRIKWYFGGIAGDERAMGQRLARGQIDGVASGGPLCEQLAPSLRALRVMGLITSTAEEQFAIDRLRPIFEGELRKQGVVPLSIVPIGPHILFATRPLKTMGDVARARLWVWDRDDVLITELRGLGVQVVALPVEDAAAAFDERRVDGFIAPPSAALAFQWSARSRYVTDLRLDYFAGCMVVADRAFDPLPSAAQEIIRAAAVKAGVRFSEVSAAQDAALLGGLFARQGVKPVVVTPSFTAEFRELAVGARDRLDNRLVPKALLTRILGILADYRVSR